MKALKRTAATPAEAGRATQLADQYFLNPASLPFSFVYGGELYKGMEKLSPKIIGDEITGRLPGLTVRVQTKRYPLHAAFEWTVRFQNETEEESKVLCEVKALDIVCAGDNPVLTHYVGDDAFDNMAYAPLHTPVRSGTRLSFQPVGGRPTNQQMPIYCFNTAQNGFYLSVGWPGQWETCFNATRAPQPDYQNPDQSVHITAGQWHLNGRLKPGEEVRTPLITFLHFDACNQYRRINLWRRFMIDCNVPRVNGKLFAPATFASTSWIYNEMGNATEENQIAAVRRYREEGIRQDWHWMDAGWYFINGQRSIEDWGLLTGSWEVDTKRFPTEFKAISDYAREGGTKTLLWFEPERVMPETYLWDTPWCLTHPQQGFKAADFGNPEFIAWLLARVGSVLTRGGISLYRQDFNLDPLPFWLEADKRENRQGFVENHYVAGYLAFWDGLLAAHPGLVIDSCASGGRRNDLESMRRAIPLHKSDSPYSDHNKKQAMHLGFYQLFPYTTAMTAARDDIHHADRYALQSSFAPGLVLMYDVNREDPGFYREIREGVAQWEQISGFFYEDYYPLTPYANNDTRWIGWQFINPETGRGLLQIYRRENAPEETKVFPLHGIDPGANYELYDFMEKNIYTGAQLLAGLTLSLPPRSSAQILINRL